MVDDAKIPNKITSPIVKNLQKSEKSATIGDMETKNTLYHGSSSMRELKDFDLDISMEKAKQ